MKNRIDLNKFNIRTDLIIDDKIQTPNIQTTKYSDSIKVTTITVDNQIKNQINRKNGTYITIEFEDITNHEDQKEIEKCLEQELTNLLNLKNIQPNDECLILGLGNRQSTADSLGPNTLDKIMITKHLFTLKTNVKKGIRSVAAISPNVMANTGIETYDIVTSLVQKITPKFIIVIDALASSSINRINTTIQLTDTGIHPGSGVGNNRKEISFETIGIPVIAIGVPTVVECSIIVNDTINYLFKHLAYILDHYDTNKLVFNHQKNYIDKLNQQPIKPHDLQKISGLLGTLEEEQKLNLIYEVLNSINYNLIVTPKEIDFLIDKLSLTIANAINHSLHKAVKD